MLAHSPNYHVPGAQILYQVVKWFKEHQLKRWATTKIQRWSESLSAGAARYLCRDFLSTIRLTSLAMDKAIQYGGLSSRTNALNSDRKVGSKFILVWYEIPWLAFQSQLDPNVGFNKIDHPPPLASSKNWMELWT